MQLRASLIVVLFFLLLPEVLPQGDSDWWSRKHNWDGHTHWSKYMILSPEYMGPNALPVPFINNGEIYQDSYLELSDEGHYSKGDKTLNLFTKLHYVIPSKAFAFQVFVVPLEYYEMDAQTRDERFVRDSIAKGVAGGDFYFSSLVQLLKDKENLPDILMNVSFKTASGTDLSNARYTDGMGFYFDFSFGKTFRMNNVLRLRPYLLAGFYAWQTNRTDNRQDDAFLFGAGLDINYGPFTFSNKAGGYSGYLGNGDKPLVYRFRTLYEKESWNFIFQFQQGLNDFEYSSLRLGVQWKFSKLLKL